MSVFTCRNMVLILMLKVLICYQFFLSDANPSAEPSISIRPTKFPSQPPSLTPTTIPSQTPTVETTSVDLLNIVTERISITMSVVYPLDDSGKQWFQRKLAEYIEEYFQTNGGAENVGSVQVDISVTEMDPPLGTTSSDGTLKITYDQSTSYQILNQNEANLITESLFVIVPLNALRKRRNLIDLLTSDDGTGGHVPFSELEQVSEPIIFKNSGISTAIIAGASVGGVVLLSLIAIFFYYRKKKRDKFFNQDAADYNPKNMAPGHVQLPM